MQVTTPEPIRVTISLRTSDFNDDEHWRECRPTDRSGCYAHSIHASVDATFERASGKNGSAKQQEVRHMMSQRLQRTLKHGGAPIARLWPSPQEDAPWRGPEPRSSASRGSSMFFSTGSCAGGRKVDLGSSSGQSCGRVQRARSLQSGCTRPRANHTTRGEDDVTREHAIRNSSHGCVGVHVAEALIGPPRPGGMVSSVVLP
jgi:hypothetical protein